MADDALEYLRSLKRALQKSCGRRQHGKICGETQTVGNITGRHYDRRDLIKLGVFNGLKTVATFERRSVFVSLEGNGGLAPQARDESRLPPAFSKTGPVIPDFVFVIIAFNQDDYGFFRHDATPLWRRYCLNGGTDDLF